MQWSMPHRALQVVASLIVLVALAAFTLGIVNAPQRGRMPGEKAAGATGAAPIAATDAVALGQERIEGAAPRELTPEEKEKAEADKEAKEEAADAAKAAAATTPEQAQAAAAPAKPAVVNGGQAEPAPAAPPAQDEAPH
jgi:hypothetical protein